MLKKILYIILYVSAMMLVVCAILSLFINAELRYLKMLDFPRIQFFIASSISLIILWIIIKKWQWYHYLLLFGLIGGLFINGKLLINYTTLVPVQVPWAKNLNSSHDSFSIILVNVKMNNKKTQPLIELIDQKKPDVILVMEVDAWWNKELKILETDYPYSQHTINQVAYGMVLFSKFPLKKVEVDYLNNEKVPSFEATLTIAEGRDISFHAIHPVPPTHFKNLPDNEGQRETAFQKLGYEIKGRKFPTILAGDFNDVVWSYADKLTNTKHLLFDVRAGRGFYNSYNAKNPLMRWPLDHVLVTEEFQLKKLERLPKMGSDHFPLFVELTL